MLDLQSDIHAHEVVTMKTEIMSLQTCIEEERRRHLEEIASMKQVIWLHAIRRWLNNSCRYVMRGWYYSCQQVKATRRCGEVLKTKYWRSLTKHALSCFCKYVGREHQHQHLGVTITSRRIYASARRWIDVWNELAQGKKLQRRLTETISSRRLRSWFVCLRKRVRELRSDDQRRPQGTQSDSTVCAPEKKQTHDVECQVKCEFMSVETQYDQAHPAASEDVGCQCELSRNHFHGPDISLSAAESQKKREEESSARLELELLTEALFKAQETIKYKDELLRDAYSADMDLKNALQNMHSQFQKAKREADDERRNATRLTYEVERLESRISSLREERNSLREEVEVGRSSAKHDSQDWGRNGGKCSMQEFENTISSRIRSPQPSPLEPLSPSTLLSRRNGGGLIDGPSQGERGEDVLDRQKQGGSRRSWTLCLNKALTRQSRMIGKSFRLWRAAARDAVVSRRMRTNLVRRQYLSRVSDYFDVSDESWLRGADYDVQDVVSYHPVLETHLDCALCHDTEKSKENQQEGATAETFILFPQD